ncbi:hypothetical protein CTheo_8654 [Ceratobasidium theobromae]|uniref:Transposase family Tnp2 protein n=1 Tax=Ceratobasidium theobromae TaxID=1582974 RepID=A0A5N5Q8A2_9AGAM|nr:hypothetical protein CTheo_8654 [Ceratobasidium theobromae]
MHGRYMKQNASIVLKLTAFQVRVMIYCDSTVGANHPVDSESDLGGGSDSDLDGSNSESDSDNIEGELGQGNSQLDSFWEGFGAHRNEAVNMTDTPPGGGNGNTSQPLAIEQSLHPGGIPHLEGGQIWIKQHPTSGQPSGLLRPDIQNSQSGNQTTHSDDILPPYFPFHSLNDFLQAEIFSDFGDTDKKIDRQLGLPGSRLSLKNAREYHQTLGLATQLWGGQFTTQRFTTHFEGQNFENYVHFQPAFPALKRVVGDPDLANSMVYYPHELWVCRPDRDNEVMQVQEELWHSKLWSTLQSRIHPDQCILYILIYIDETSVSTIGGVNVWPIYAWVGNLPASICKRRNKKGGAILLGYLPKARKESGVRDLAGFRCQVFHNALNIIFESLKIPSRHGAPVRCGNGIIHELVPVIAAESADYMEIIKMICILGHSSDFPCPICLVPRLEQSRLTKSWPIRTTFMTKQILSQAKKAESAVEKDAILKKQSLQSVRSVFLDVIPPIHSVYNTIIADPLHQIEQGIWGKHLWPWIRDQLPRASKEILDARFKSIPRYPDLKHFPNGVTGLKYITGKEHAVILRTIGPLLEDLLSKEYQGLILSTFRTLAIIHMLAKFTTHTDISLEELGRQIYKFNRLHSKMVQIFDNLNANYPKFHSLSHLVDIIRWHSTTDNYHTGLGEALHPQSKKDYRHTNHQMDFEVQMLRMHQEREAIIRIRARINAANLQNEDNEPVSTLSWDGPNVQLGSPNRSGRQPAPEFVHNQMQTDPAAQDMERVLREFLYYEIGGFGNRIRPREVDLPQLDGMLVGTHRYPIVGPL